MPRRRGFRSERNYKLRAIKLILQPLRMPERAQKGCREHPSDEHDFKDFMRLFIQETKDGYSEMDEPDNKQISAVVGKERFD